MAYCTYQNVAGEFKGLDVASGILTSTILDDWIAQDTAYINAKLKTVYTTPITDADDLLILKKICIGMVAQRVSRFMEVKSISPKGDQYIPRDLIKEAMSTMDEIVNEKLILNSTKAVSGGIVSSYTNDYTVERVFDTTIDQW